MRKILFTLSALLFLASCTTYKPIIDTAGRSGTYTEDKAKEISNDLQHCEQLARKNTNLLNNFAFWSMSPQAESRYTDIYRKCMINRGHSVLN